MIPHGDKIWFPKENLNITRNINSGIRFFPSSLIRISVIVHAKKHKITEKHAHKDKRGREESYKNRHSYPISFH